MKLITQRFAELLSLTLIAAAAPAAAGVFAYEADFDGPSGSRPEGWVNLTDVDGIFVDEGELVLRRDDVDSSGEWRTIVYNGSSARFWSDYTAEVRFRDSRQHDVVIQPQGIVARWQAIAPVFTNTLHGYYAYRLGDEIRIDRDFHVSGAETNLASAPLSRSLEEDAYYRLRFTLEHDNLHAELFDDDGVSLGSVSAEDPTYVQGTAGVRAYHSFHGRETRFRDFSIEGDHNVPENLLLAESFVEHDGDVPAEWDKLPPVDITDIRNRVLRMRRDEHLGDSGWARAVGYRGNGSEEWTDYSVEVWLRHNRQHNAPDTQSIIARWQGNIPAFAEDGHGYMAQHWGESDGPGQIQIVRDFVRSGGDPNVLATAALDESLGQDQWYRLRFTLEGSELTAEIFRTDGTRIGHVTASDAAYESGSVGLRARIGVVGRETQFSGLTVAGEVPQAVPFRTDVLPMTEEGHFRMRVQTAPFREFVIEVSEDLSNWAELTGAQADAEGLHDFTDADTEAFERRFFRVRP